MEFFDFTGTNEEEKAQAWDIISQESTGVEFFLEYDNANAHANNNNISNTKPSYRNGIPSPQIANDQQHSNEINSFNSSPGLNQVFATFPVGVPQHMGHPHHQPPYGYPHAFPHPTAAAFLSPPFSQQHVPVYFIPHPEGQYLHYQHFRPHMQVYDNEHVPLEFNQSPLSSSANLSSIIYQHTTSSESQIDTSKQNVQNSSSTLDDSVNNRLVSTSEAPIQFVSPVVNNKPSSSTASEATPVRSSSTLDDSTNSRLVSTSEAPIQLVSPVVNNKPSSSTASETTPVKSSEPPKVNAHDPNLLVGNIISSSAPAQTQATQSSWASKLFGASPSANASQNKIAGASNIKPAVNGDIETKSAIANGEFPELSTNKSANSRMNKNRQVDDISSKLTVISMKKDAVAMKISRKLRDSNHLKHTLPNIMPCGLINRGNWCYVNATLQALLACPPFYNLMCQIGETNGIFRQLTATPIIDNFARFFNRFLPTDYKRQKKTPGQSATSYLEELLNNDAYEPMCIYDTLKHIGMIKNDAQRGHQEDAEEFLSSVLNGLHEEMIKLSNLLSETENGQKTNGFGSHDGPLVEDDDDKIWHEVGTSKHKALPTRSATVVSTAITEIFGGSTLDVRTVNKDNNSSGNRQPFFALQLDIKPQNIKNLEDAIRWQTRREMIQGYTCSKTKQVVEASNQMFLETVPPILILHLKLFDYDIQTGAGRKVLKRIDFGENFDIPRECFPRNNDGKHCKRYKLLAVVYHNGSEAMKGHYVTDVYHLGLNQWLRCDDATINVISISQVLSPEANGNMVPYLLFYRRQDTLASSSNTVVSTPHSAHVNGGTKLKAADQHHHAAPHHSNHANSHNQHNQVTINTSNKFSYISRQHN